MPQLIDRTTRFGDFPFVSFLPDFPVLSHLLPSAVVQNDRTLPQLLHL